MHTFSLWHELWTHRDRDFSVGSGAWLRAWAKRLLQFPQLFRQIRARNHLLRAGATVSASSFFSDVRQISGRLNSFSVGNESFVGRVEISAHAAVTIGNRVCINDGVKILTASHDIRHPNWPTVAKPVKIEDYAWIATNAIILPGVTIGRGAVVGAGAVVSQNVPANAIARGNPAVITMDQRSLDLDYSPVSHLALFTSWRRLRMPEDAPSTH
jgi:acetyltransferase-like isoleucine patch superfamily enzyme